MKGFRPSLAFQMAAGLVVLLAFRPSAMVEAFQGVATSTRPAKSANIRTSLPPIKVDFRDIAEEAGLTALNVTGDRENKRYILETTGNGVAIFDFDNDGLMDILIVNG